MIYWNVMIHCSIIAPTLRQDEFKDPRKQESLFLWISLFIYMYMYICIYLTEAAIRGVMKISQYSQENTCVRVSF